MRELREEVGVDGIDPAQLVQYSRLITPEHIRTRFDTHFFLAVVPPAVEARCDGVECVALRWMSARAALDAHAGGKLALVFPTIKHLQALTEFERADDVRAHTRVREVRPVLPRVMLGGDAPGSSCRASPATRMRDRKAVQKLQLLPCGSGPISGTGPESGRFAKCLQMAHVPGVPQAFGGA